VATSTKVCPKCNNSPKMHLFQGAQIILPMDAVEKEGVGMGDSYSLPLDVYHCPECHYIELYAETL
jgi:predicted nucleic-acid-binding Zn-ribbon protein